MNRRMTQLLAGSIVAAFLTACGGGGGSSSPAPTPTPTPTSSVKKSTTISGTVALVSLNSLVAKRTQKVSVRKAAGEDAAQIFIRSYDKKDALLHAEYKITSGTTGAFAQDVDLSDVGGYVIITVTKPGYADFSKRVDYDKPSALNLKAELAKATTGVGTPDSTATNIINIGVVRNLATGAKTVYSGAAFKAARKAAGSQVELDMKIDTSALPSGTNKVIGQFETFNATDPTQAQYFPGAYYGAIKNSAGTVSSEGKLVSMAFDYIDLTTNQGKSVFKEIKKLAKAGKAAKAASVVSKVSRWVPESSCENLFLHDGDTTTANRWDVPIWSIDPYAGDGTWLKIGDGIVSTYSGSLYTPVDMSTKTVAAAKAECKSGGYYVDITVTNPTYLDKWWNLDHIILSTETPKDVCVTGKIVDDSGKPLTDLWLYMYDEDYQYDSNGNQVITNSQPMLLSANDTGAQSFDYGYGVTDSTGAFTLKSALFSNSDLDRTATISYYDPIDYSYKEQAVTVGLSPACGTQNITVIRPAVCTVKGALSGATTSGELITLYNGGTNYYYNYTYTNSDGSFSAEVPCARDIEVYVGNNWTSAALFNVNGKTTDHPDFEVTDSGSAAGSIVTLKPLTKTNTPPEIWGSLDTYYAPTSQAVTASVYAYDVDGDYPISYSVSYLDKAGKQVKVASGTITKTQADSGTTLSVTLPTTLTAGSYNLNISATDSTGNSSAESPLGTLLVYDATAGGFAPSVSLYAGQSTINSTDLGLATFSVPLYAYASDLDGAATLTYKWTVKYNGTALSTTETSTVLAYNPTADLYSWGSDSYLNATFTPPKTVGGKAVGDGAIFTIELTVTDPTSNSATAFVELKVGTVVTYPGTITIQKPALFKQR